MGLISPIDHPGRPRFDQWGLILEPISEAESLNGIILERRSANIAVLPIAIVLDGAYKLGE